MDSETPRRKTPRTFTSTWNSEKNDFEDTNPESQSAVEAGENSKVSDFPTPYPLRQSGRNLRNPTPKQQLASTKDSEGCESTKKGLASKRLKVLKSEGIEEDIDDPAKMSDKIENVEAAGNETPKKMLGKVAKLGGKKRKLSLGAMDEMDTKKLAKKESKIKKKKQDVAKGKTEVVTKSAAKKKRMTKSAKDGSGRKSKSETDARSASGKGKKSEIAADSATGRKSVTKSIGQKRKTKAGSKDLIGAKGDIGSPARSSPKKKKSSKVASPGKSAKSGSVAKVLAVKNKKREVGKNASNKKGVPKIAATVSVGGKKRKNAAATKS